MAKDNSWKTVAEIYRDREHKLLRQLQDHLDTPLDVNNPEQLFEWVNGVNSLVQMPLLNTGRTPGKPVEVPVIISPVDGARSELLALLGVSEGQQRALSHPQSGTFGVIPVRTRKVRSDKGKPRGPRKKKVTV